MRTKLMLPALSMLVIAAACGGTTAPASSPSSAPGTPASVAASPSVAPASQAASTSAAPASKPAAASSAPASTAASAPASSAAGSAPAASASGASASSGANAPIDHIVVIYQENHSFDNLYGTFPGAEGLSQATNAAPQIDASGRPYDTLPAPTNSNLTACSASAPAASAAPCSSASPQNPDIVTGLKPLLPDPRFPKLPNKPFDIDQFIPADMKTGDLVHRFYQEPMQIDGGKMDKFAAISDSAGLSMGYYDGSKFPLWSYAQQYTLADHFFHAAFGGSFLNHFWLVCACSPRWDNAPTDLVAQLDPSGKVVKDGQVTPDGYAINTSFTVNTPHPASAKPEQLVPQQTMPHIGDRLDAKNVSWAWYSGGWNDAVAGKPDPLFQFHHQTFAFFKDLADGTDGRAKHLKDETDFMAALKNNSLPSVAFVKPIGADNEHPGYTDVVRGEKHAADLIKSILDSPYGKSTAIILTYDENGGFWDHVAPPVVDKWGPGTRVPTLIVSPYAKKGFVDKTVYDTTSILRFIEWRFDLQPLGDRDAKVNNLLNAFDFTQKVS